MSDLFVFADEAGNFDFSRNVGASRYFILTTVTLTDPLAGAELLRLRHRLLAEGAGPDRGDFHAAEDQQAVRDRVFAVLAPQTFRVDCTLLEKSKAMPHVRSSNARFYKVAWFYHMKHVAPLIAGPGDLLAVVGASLGERKKQKAFRAAILDVAFQTSRAAKTQVACWSASCDPCLQIADYCSWAIQRKWERGDTRSYGLIAAKIASEYDLWAGGTTHYY
jgi:hypothetical protein